MNISSLSLSIFLLSLLISGASTLQLDPKAPLFTYSGTCGPDRWGSLSPVYSKCSSGKWQSPVNIRKDKVFLNRNLKPLIRDYRPANATLINNGFNIGIHYEEYAGVLNVEGKNYTLKQLHWHSPSEHRINGVQYPLELHLVHKSDDGNLSVVAVLFQYSVHADPFLSEIKEGMNELYKEVCKGDEEAHIPLGTLDVKQLKKNTKKYYRYVGSLTTPPCSESVTWNILAKVRCITKEQVDALKAPLHSPYKNNSRPCQPLHERKIELYNELYVKNKNKNKNNDN
ncbi:hypothetical protein TIFTF001_008694 [Ficus carica]|uniref:Carbonic anhydrase n=1 Tax=Ficus carica TaxID=3494 RepID=A0AA88A5D5_FICCA|nr:hypothetical protein TIFTF001_008694 [Ficus carica]